MCLLAVLGLQGTVVKCTDAMFFRIVDSGKIMRNSDCFLFQTRIIFIWSTGAVVQRSITAIPSEILYFRQISETRWVFFGGGGGGRDQV